MTTLLKFSSETPILHIRTRFFYVCSIEFCLSLSLCRYARTLHSWCFTSSLVCWYFFPSCFICVSFINFWACVYVCVCLSLSTLVALFAVRRSFRSVVLLFLLWLCKSIRLYFVLLIPNIVVAARLVPPLSKFDSIQSVNVIRVSVSLSLALTGLLL